MTDAEVEAQFQAKGSFAFDCGLMCTKCNQDWGSHSGTNCTDSLGNNVGTTFSPAARKVTVSWDLDVPWLVGDKKSKIAPSKKEYKDTCQIGRAHV